MRLKSVWFAVALVVLSATKLPAYSVLAHEATIDICWTSTIAPALVRRFPRSSAASLTEARAYAYGGAVIQDLGYYPFGNKFFSNLLHYVRSGDFVEALVRNAKDANELAFALGALAHYVNDTSGHPEAVNRAVPMVFPKLRQKYGDTVTYVEAPKQHVVVEFSFDMVQAAAGAFPSASYRQFIGFKVATPLLSRTFAEIYGLRLDEVFADEERAIGSYRYAISQIFPAITEAAWKEKHDDIVKLIPAVERSGFVVQYPRQDFETDFGPNYQRPGWFPRLLGVVYRIVPKIGPLKPLGFKAPPPEAEKYFAASFREATSRFRTATAAIGRGELQLRNADLDTGQLSRHGEYPMADDTYAELLDHWANGSFENVPVAIRREALAFYGANPRPVSKTDRKHWQDTHSTLIALQGLTGPRGL